VDALEKDFRAPADCPKTGFLKLLAAVISSRFWPKSLCFHRHITLPLNNRQNCLDCGASRLYIFDTDFEHANAGIFIGKWRHAQADSVPQQIASRMIEESLPCAEMAVRG
jgi:hypothetical protein